MINIDDAYQFVNFLVDKAQRGQVRPSDFNRVINIAQYSLYKQRLGLPESLNIGDRRLFYEADQKISLDLKPFRKEAQVAIGADGYGNYPDDHYYDISLRRRLVRKKTDPAPKCGDYILVNDFKQPEYVAYEVPLEYVAGNKWAKRTNSRIVPPDEDHPIFTYYADQFKVNPVGPAVITMEYLKKPTEAVWAYTQGTGNVPIYDAASSVDLEWREDMLAELAYRVLQEVGVNLSSQEITNYANAKIEAGQ